MLLQCLLAFNFCEKIILSSFYFILFYFFVLLNIICLASLDTFMTFSLLLVLNNLILVYAIMRILQRNRINRIYIKRDLL